MSGTPSFSKYPETSGTYWVTPNTTANKKAEYTEIPSLFGSSVLGDGPVVDIYI